ncbi:MAG: hypothetical protein IJ583_01190 [Firmicutes bacterium]|nr:hypothetical protein [Bacillota bacterium]
MVRVFKAYGYSLEEVMQHRKSRIPERVTIEEEYIAGFSVYSLSSAILAGNTQ